MPNLNTDPRKRYQGQQPEESQFVPPGLAKRGPALPIGGGISGQGRPDFSRGFGGGNSGFAGQSRGLGFGFGNNIQDLVEQLRKRRQMGMMEPGATQDQRLGRYLGGNGGY